MSPSEREADERDVATAADPRCSTSIMGLFLVYLFLPLIVMAAATFNTSRFPTVTPWRGFTLQWFAVLWNDRRDVDRRCGTASDRGRRRGRCSRCRSACRRRCCSTACTAGRATVLYALMVSPLLTPGRDHRHLDAGVLGPLLGVKGGLHPGRDRPIQLHRGLCDAAGPGAAAALRPHAGGGRTRPRRQPLSRCSAGSCCPT